MNVHHPKCMTTFTIYNMRNISTHNGKVDISTPKGCDSSKVQEKNINLGKRLNMVLKERLGKNGPHGGAKPLIYRLMPFCLLLKVARVLHPSHVTNTKQQSQQTSKHIAKK